MPAPRKQSQADLCEFKTNLVYKVCSKTARDTQINPVLKKQKKKKKKKVPNRAIFP